MPGLAVIVGYPDPSDLALKLTAMLAPLTWPDYRSGQAVLPELGIAIGRTGPARLSLPQPGYARNGEVVAVIEGEVLNVAALARRLDAPESAAPAAVVAALYAAEGLAAVERLRGHCSVAIVDRKAQQVVVANDALGLRPIYWTRAADRSWLFASSPAALLAYPGLGREVDPAGLADFLAFGYGLGTKTLFRGIQCMPPATQSVLQGLALGGAAVREPVMSQYWRLGGDAPTDATSRADLEVLREMFNNTVVETAGGAGGLSLALSGGMDSRAILSALVVAGMDVGTLTHSVPDATDACISSQLAQLGRTTHHFYEVRGEDLAGAILPGIRLTGGQIAGIDAHPLCFLDDMAGYTQVALTGMGGALYKASAASGALVNSESQTLDGLTDGLFHLLNYKLKPDTDFPALLTEDWLARLQHQPRESIRESMTGVSRHVPLSGVSGIVFLQEYMRKYLTKGDLLVRRSIETRHPMVMRDLLGQVYHLPYQVRKDGNLLRYIVTRNVPAMADLPYEKDGQPMRYPLTAWDEVRQKARIVRRSLRRRLGRPPYRSVPSYRYAEWMRGPLRNAFTDVLLDARTLGRPYWQSQTIRDWVGEHMAGRDHTSRLGLLLSIELILREFVDAAPRMPGPAA